MLSICNRIFSNAYHLCRDTINFYIPEKVCGIYILGRSIFGQFKPRYVGRSDVDLNKRLNQHAKHFPKYPLFCFRILNSCFEAYEYECYLFHELGKTTSLDNEYHPDSPDFLDLECPYEFCESKHNQLSKSSSLLLYNLFS